MKTILDSIKKKIKGGSFLGSLSNDIENFFCGIGESKILGDSIKITDYPFEPSLIFPNQEILASSIDEIHLDEYPPTLKIGNELIFISREDVEALTGFANKNKVKTAKRNSNWDRIAEPFLDTEYSKEQQLQTIKQLEQNGVSEKEVLKLREEVGDYMMEYNFATFLWEWCNLGLTDVLSAMRVTLSKEDFHEFYWRAMEIEQRKLEN